MRKEPQSSKAAAQGARGPALFARRVRNRLAHAANGNGFLEFGPFVFCAELGALGAFGLSHGTRVGAFGVGGA